MTSRIELLQMFQNMTGTTVHTPKGEPDSADIQSYFPDRSKTYFGVSTQIHRVK